MKLSCFIQLFLRSMSVNSSKSSLDFANLLADLRAENLELRFEAVGKICFHIILEGNSLRIELTFDDFLEELRKLFVCFDIEVCYRLTVLDVGCVACSASEDNNLQYEVHIRFKLCIDECFVCSGIIAEMYALRRIFINAAYEISVDALGNERNHRSSSLYCCNQRRIKSHVRVDLILFHTLRPEALTTAAYIPITELVNKLLQSLCSFGNFIRRKVSVYFLHHGVKA